MASLTGIPHDMGGLPVSDPSTEIFRKLHDPAVLFEEYLFHAKESRAWENNNTLLPQSGGLFGALKNRFGHAKQTSDVIQGQGGDVLGNEVGNVISDDKGLSSKGQLAPDSLSSQGHGVTDEEWAIAARAGRTVTWGAVFWLLTTDILGPFSVPWAYAQTGFGPGWALYTTFGGFAGYTGWQIWNMFIHLDSAKYPLKTYGDIAFRVYGPWARHGVNVLQSLQLLFIVSGVILSSGQGIAQISKNSICYILCLFIFTAVGMFAGQVRTLKSMSWLGNVATCLNWIIMIIVMAVSAHSLPNYKAALASFSIPEGPVVTYAGTPPGTDFVQALNGLNQAIYSYGGSMMFCEFMSEMRKPADFWKSLICAQAAIYCCYVIFGTVVYHAQGQFAFNPAMQGLSPYAWQTACNIIFLVSSLFATALYTNIGIKVFYWNVLQENFHAPALTSTKGKLLWVGLVPIYWAVAFVIGAAIPQFSYISGLVGAVCILQFTYTFPPILMMGFSIKRGAILESERFDPNTGEFARSDSGMKRWARGYMANWKVNTFNLFFALGAITTAVLGIYSSIVSLKEGFDGKTVATSFGCTAPV